MFSKIFLLEESFDMTKEWKNGPDIWKRNDGVRNMMEQFRYFVLHASELEIKNITSYCNMYNSQIELMKDYKCRALWRQELFSLPIVDIDIMLGFSGKKLGAMKLKLSNGKWAWFKPCGEGDEMPEYEVVGSLFDEIFQLHRVAPVVMRNISTSLLTELLKQKYSSFDSKHKILVTII